MSIYSLMHKDINVLDFKLDYRNNVTEILVIHSFSHLPLYLQSYNSKVTVSGLNDWISKRCVPLSREDININIKYLNMNNPRILIGSWYFSSLSDQYWIKSVDDRSRWSDITLLINPFNDSIGEVLLGHRPIEVDVKTPDASLGGSLKKKWTIENNTRKLFKMGRGETQQEVFNECIASEICKRMNFNYVNYHTEIINNQVFSVCNCFIKPYTELVYACDLLNMFKINCSVNTYDKYITILSRIGLRDSREYLDNMLLLDFIMGNIDRSFDNFGIVRHSDTLKAISVAPIFGTDNSLFTNVPAKLVDIKRDELINSFEDSEYKQFNLIRTKYDFTLLTGLIDWVRDYLVDTGYLCSEKIQKIIEFMSYRIDYARVYLHNNRSYFIIDRYINYANR